MMTWRTVVSPSDEYDDMEDKQCDKEIVPELVNSDSDSNDEDEPSVTCPGFVVFIVMVAGSDTDESHDEEEKRADIPKLNKLPRSPQVTPPQSPDNENNSQESDTDILDDGAGDKNHEDAAEGTTGTSQSNKRKIIYGGSSKRNKADEVSNEKDEENNEIVSEHDEENNNFDIG